MAFDGTLTPTIALAALAVVPFLRSVRGEFLFDDPIMFDEDGPRGMIFRRFRIFRDDYRAMVHVLDSWLWRLFQVNPTGKDETGTRIIQPAWPWHVLSLAFHLGSTLAVWSLAGLFLDPLRAWAAAVIFAVHPLQVSAVGYISGRAGVQAWFFSALGLLHAVAGGWHWLAVPVCVYLAYKSKQDGLVYLVLYPIVLRKSWLPWWVLGVLVTFWTWRKLRANRWTPYPCTCDGGDNCDAHDHKGAPCPRMVSPKREPFCYPCDA